jgi:putative transposase
MNILKDAQQGRPVADIRREYGVSNAQFYRWRSKYGGMDAPMISGCLRMRIALLLIG